MEKAYLTAGHKSSALNQKPNMLEFKFQHHLSNSLILLLFYKLSKSTQDRDWLQIQILPSIIWLDPFNDTLGIIISNLWLRKPRHQELKIWRLFPYTFPEVVEPRPQEPSWIWTKKGFTTSCTGFLLDFSLWRLWKIQLAIARIKWQVKSHRPPHS